MRTEPQMYFDPLPFPPVELRRPPVTVMPWLKLPPAGTSMVFEARIKPQFETLIPWPPAAPPTCTSMSAFSMRTSGPPASVQFTETAGELPCAAPIQRLAL